MPRPLNAFLEEIIDYAGMFPPAKLPLETAIANYAAYRREPDAWLLGRFICPAGQLPKLREYKDTLFAENPPFRFAVLGRAGKDQQEFMNGLAADLRDTESFLEFHQERVTAAVLETRLPLDILRSGRAAAVAKFLNAVAEKVEQSALPSLKLFYEVPAVTQWEECAAAAIAGIAEHNQQIAQSGKFRRYQSAGFKLRCGGAEPQSYPSVERVAMALSVCRRHKVVLKATAGLHHPVRHFNVAEKVTMHGFLNVFGAAVLGDNHDLDEEQLREIIADENPQNFMFTSRAFAWKTLRASSEAIRVARGRTILSFGSCSFDEPRADLRSLNLL